MAGASQSRLAKAGGNAQLAAQSLAQEFAAGAPGWSAEQKAAYANPATRDAFIARQIGQSTKGKYSGALGGAVKLIGKAAPLAALAIPGLGALGAAGIGAIGGAARGGGIGGILGGAAMGGLGSAAIGSVGGAVGGLQKLGITPAQAIQGGLAGLGMIQGAQQQGQANRINADVLNQLKQQAAVQDQLRQQALARLQQGAAQGNPFSQFGAVR